MTPARDAQTTHDSTTSFGGRYQIDVWDVSIISMSAIAGGDSTKRSDFCCAERRVLQMTVMDFG